MPVSTGSADAAASRSLPPSGLTTLVVAGLVVLWGYLRLHLFGGTLLPLTYVLPLLAGVWTRRRWHVWSMAVSFGIFTVIKALAMQHDGTPLTFDERVFTAASLTNIALGATIVHLLIRYRERLDEQAAVVFAQKAELETQSQELMQQNEEIRAQSEELARQNGKIQAQSEELSRQNDELHDANHRLAIREQMLEDLLASSRLPDDSTLAGACRRTLAILAPAADIVAILDRAPGANPGFTLAAQAGGDGARPLPSRWPAERSLAEVVTREGRTAYVSDITTEPVFAAPFEDDPQVRSLLATPLRIEGQVVGVLLAGSFRPTHWTEEQFRLVEWLAALCSHLVRGVRARAALAARSTELEAAQRAKDEFLARLAQELRAPLPPVLAAAGALAVDQRLPIDAREDLAMIRRNLGGQSRLIDDVLDLTRIERGKLELNLQPCAPAALLRDAAAIAAPEADAKEQIVTVHCDVPEKWRLAGDPARLQQVLWNLIQNATKFCPPRSHIQLAARVLAVTPPRIELSVTDNGPGIPAAEMERLLQPFEPARNGRRAGRDAGLGLGLAISRAIVELHHGKLAVASGPSGRGARFSVELPLAAAGASADGTPAREATGEPAREAMSILLVEDHSDTGRVIAQLLKGAGHEVVHTTSAADALATFGRRRFNLVISDIGLPDESGLVLMRRLRELQPGLAGVCMTGYGMESDQRACREAGFSEHLPKPVDVQRLHAAINRIARSGERLSGV